MTDFSSRHLAWWRAGQTAPALPAHRKGRRQVHVIHAGQTHVYSISPGERLAFLRWLVIAFPVQLAGISLVELNTYALRKLLGENGVLVIEP